MSGIKNPSSASIQPNSWTLDFSVAVKRLKDWWIIKWDEGYAQIWRVILVATQSGTIFYLYTTQCEAHSLKCKLRKGLKILQGMTLLSVLLCDLNFFFIQTF